MLYHIQYIEAINVPVPYVNQSVYRCNLRDRSVENILNLNMTVFQTDFLSFRYKIHLRRDYLYI